MDRREDADADAVRAVAAAALAVPAGTLDVSRTSDGVSAVVYRVGRAAGDEWFVRLAEERGENLEVDAEVLRRLAAMGVAVPEVVHAERFVDALDRSVIVTRHIGGVPLEASADHAGAREVARRAGRDLAILNTVAVDGFGWVNRRVDTARWPVAAELPDYATFVEEDLPAPWPGAFAELFAADVLERLAAIVADERSRRVERAFLAHGDFGFDHVFHRDGAYTGMIDFGELRGTEPLFDLGVLAWSGVPRREALFDAVLDGYAEVARMPADAHVLIHRSGLLKLLRQLGRWLQPTFAFERDAAGMARWVTTRVLPAAEGRA